MKGWMSWFKLSHANWLADLAIWMILVVPLVFSTAFYQPFGFSRYVWLMLALAVLSFGLLVARRYELHYVWWRQPAFWLASFWLLVAVVSAMAGVNPFRSWWGTVSRGGTGMFFFIGVWLMGVLLYLAINRKEYWLKLWSAMSWVGGFSALYAILQALKIDWLPIIASTERVSALMGNPIFFGQLLLFTIFLTLYFVIVSSNRSRWWYAASLFLQVVALFLTASRGPLSGLVVGGLVWAVGAWSLNRRSWQLNWRWVTGISSAVVVLIFAIIWLVPRADLARIFQLTGDTITTRLVTWQTAWHAIQAKPLLGYGIENAWYAFAHFYQPGLAGINFAETVIDRAHNFVLDQLLVNGWLGLIAMLALLGYLGWALGRYAQVQRRKNNFSRALLGWSLLAMLIAYYVANLTAFDTLVTIIYGGIILAGAIALVSQDLPQPIPLQPVLLWRIVLGLICLGLVFFDIKYLLPALKISHYVGVAENAAEGGRDYQTAAKAYAKAQETINPYRWSFLTNYPLFVQQYDGILLKDKKYSAASALTVDGMRVLTNIKQQEPDRVAILIQYPVLLSIMSGFDPSYKAKAEESFNGLVKDFPDHEYIYINWARSLLGMGKYQEALNVLNQVPTRFKALPLEFEFLRALTNVQLKSRDQQQIIADLKTTTLRDMPYYDGDQGVLKLVISYLANRLEWKTAVWYQNKLVSISPSDVSERINLSAIYKELGEYDKAAEQARIVVKLDPSKLEATKQFLQSIGRSL